MSTTPRKDPWDKMQALAALLASLLVPIAVAFVGNGYATAMKDSENKLKYVELAISILRADPTKENVVLRGWAVEVLSSQSVVPISDDVKRQLRSSPLTSKYFGEFIVKGPMSSEMAEFFKYAASAAKPAVSAASR